MTITITSDDIGRQMARQLRTVLTPFEVYRSGPDVRLRCYRCVEILIAEHTSSLWHLVQLALEHDCEAAE